MNIVIVGQGAIGLLCYAHISQVTAKQTSLLSSANQHENTNFTFTDHHNHEHNFAINNAEVNELKQADVIVYCVKSYQVCQAVKETQPFLKANALMVLAHNGMGCVEELASKVDLNITQPLLAMLMTHGSKKLSSSHIEHTGVGVIDIGLVDIDLAERGTLATSQAENRVQQLLSILTSAMPPVHWHNNIQQKQWLKLAVNCVINPITAINNIDNGQVNSAQYKPLIEKVMTEVVTVAKSVGVLLKFDELITTVLTVADATAKNCSSMRADVLANKTTEIDYINGYIHNLGKQNGIATPENTQLWQTVKALEALSH